MFSVRSAPQPKLSAHLEVSSKSGTVEVTASEKGVLIYQQGSGLRTYPSFPISLTHEEADALVEAIQATRRARS